ncbi:MAG: hypothetical protein K0R39_4880 [Symbiobacteriaceae bacterium]|jgi:hypothetical protein|nr:hypothetical protein [Symbiobacteriaceae bacterium]
MKKLALSIALVLVVAGCTGGPAPAKSEPAPQPDVAPSAPVSTPPAAPVEPLITFADGQVRLSEGIVGSIPDGTAPAGFTLLLDGFNQETASITFEECPAEAPDSGCVGNHRAVNFTRKVTVAGRSVTQIEAIMQQPAAANDPRSWVERHTVLILPSGRKVDIIGQALSGSEAEPKLRTVYQKLLDSLKAAK